MHKNGIIFTESMRNVCGQTTEDINKVIEILIKNDYNEIVKKRLFNNIMPSENSFDFVQGTLAGTVERKGKKAELVDLIFNPAIHLF